MVAVAVVVGMVVVELLPLRMVMVIFDSQKKTQRAWMTGIYATTVKFLEASSRCSRKIKGGIYKRVPLMLSLEKQYRYS